MEEKKPKKNEPIPRLSRDSLSQLNNENSTTKELKYSSRSIISNNSLFGGSVCSDQQFSSILRIYSARVTQQVELMTSPRKSKHNTTTRTFRSLFKRTKKVSSEAKQLTIKTDVNQNDTTYHSSTPTTHVSSLSPTKSYLSPDRAYNNNYNSFDENANTSRTCSTKAVSVAESPHRTDLRLIIPTDDTPTTVHTATNTPLPLISAQCGQQSNNSVKAQTDKSIYSSLYSMIYKSIRNNRNSTVFIPCIAVIILTVCGKNLIALCILSLLTLRLVYYYIYTLVRGRHLVGVNE